MTYSYTRFRNTWDLRSALSSSLSGWLAGKRCPRRHASRPLLRTGPGDFIPSGRSRGSPVRTVGAVQEPGAGLIPETTPGTTCSGKAFSCSSASSRMGAFGSTSHAAISRSASRGRRVLATALLPSSMLSANWIAHPACWSGRPAPPAIRRSLTQVRHGAVREPPNPFRISLGDR